MSLTQAALQQLATPSGGTVTVGETTVHTGGITVSGDVDLSGENFHLTLNSDGALGTGIDDSEGDKTITLNAKTLTLSAQGGIGATNAIKFDAATVSAVNSGTGMELKLAPTGDITLGSASTKIDQNVSGGSIRCDRGRQNHGGGRRGGDGRRHDHAGRDGDDQRHVGRDGCLRRLAR